MARTEPHMLAFPKGLLALRIIQAVLALIILALCGYGLSVLPLDGTGLELFAALATMISAAYILTASISVPKIYNYWAILGLDIFCFIFWLTSAGHHGAEVGVLIAVINGNYSSYGGCAYGYCRRSLAVLETRGKSKYSGGGSSSSSSSSSSDSSDYYYGSGSSSYYGRTWGAWGPVMLTAVALAGLQVILFIISLVLHSIALYRHRKNGGHCTAARNTAYGGDVGMNNVQPAQPEYYQYDKQQAQAHHVQV